MCDEVQKYHVADIAAWHCGALVSRLIAGPLAWYTGAFRDMKDALQVPVVDLFAGPGGLGEGFAAFRDPVLSFETAISIEKDVAAHRTLTLRHFFRSFGRECAPQEYYQYLRGEIDSDKLFAAYPEHAASAKKACLRAELGVTAPQRINHHIRNSLSPVPWWVLIGGPPCQAYSIVGRSRMRTLPREEFEQDNRHYLYREYLRILARFEPPVFVMENVKGLLSSKIDGEPVFEQILHDLTAPALALRSAFGSHRREKTPRQYQVFSLAVDGDSQHLKPQDFVVYTEKFGIPQKRHRVILLGVRSDVVKPAGAVLCERPELTVDAVLSELPKLRSRLSQEPDSAEAWRKALRDGLQEGLLDFLDYKTKAAMRSAIGGNGTIPPVGGRFVPRSGPKTAEPRLDWFSDPRLDGFCNHESRPHIREDLYRYVFVSCYGLVKGVSPRLCNFPEALLPEHKNVGEAVKQVYGYFSDRFRVQLGDAPAATVTSHIAKDGHYFIHHDPAQCRSWTVREAARVQTFPDNYFFEGTRTEQYRQVGNAVPPLLAVQIAGIVASIIQTNMQLTLEAETGRRAFA